LSPIRESGKVNTITISLEIPPPLTLIFGLETARWHILRREVAAGTLLGDVLSLYALSHPEFRKGIFDPIRRELNDGLSITLNGILLDAERKMDSELIEGDRITIVPDHLPEPKNPG
jgi:hypothetical protein